MHLQLAVRLIEDGILFGGECPYEAKGIFGTVPDSMFVLFNVMNGDQGTLEPLLKIMPVMKLVFALFMITTSWAILSILTAVVSENMIAVTEKSRAEREAIEFKVNERRKVAKLTEIFAALDEDKSGEVDEREFGNLLVDSNRADELSDTAGCSKYDLVDLFDILSTPHSEDHGKGRTMKYMDFIEGLSKEGDGVTQRSIMRLESRLREIYMSQREMRAAFQWMIGEMAGPKKISPRWLTPSKPSNNAPQLPEASWRAKPMIDGMEIQGHTKHGEPEDPDKKLKGAKSMLVPSERSNK